MTRKKSSGLLESSLPIATPSVINKKDRGVLSEGRNYQMGFAFCKREGDAYTTVQPISPCKDYLNDIVWSERCGKPVYAFGLSYTKQDIFDEDRAYVVISICDRGGWGGSYADLEKDKENLKKNYKTLQHFVNQIEELLKLPLLTEIVEIEDNLYLATIPIFWTNATYLISLWSLLMRTGQFYKEGDAMKYLENFKEFGADVYIVNSALPKLKKIIKGVIPQQKFDTFRGGTDVHNHGIVAANIV